MLSLIAYRDASTISPSWDSPKSRLPRICLPDAKLMFDFMFLSSWLMKPRVIMEALLML